MIIVRKYAARDTRPRPMAKPILANAVTLEKTRGRLLEVYDVLLEQNTEWTVQLLLRRVRALYTHRLRGLTAF